MPLRIVAFFVVIIPALLALTGYVMRRAAEVVGLDDRGRRALTAVAWALVSLPFALRLVGALEIAGLASLVGFGVGLGCLIAFAFLVPVGA